MKNLHLINNEKITLEMIRLFDRMGGHNVYVIFNRKMNYLNDSDQIQNVFFAHQSDLSYLDIKYDNIILHSLDIKKVHFFRNNIKFENIIWLLWGGEIYNRPEFRTKLFGRETLQAIIKSNPIKEMLKMAFGKVRGDLGEMGEIKKFASNINVIATTLPHDYMLAKKIFNINPSFKAFNFYKLDERKKIDIVLNKESSMSLSIILGNSGDPSNNHCEMINMISKLKTKAFVKCPLSYGPSSYINKVVKKGKNKLSNYFQPLTSFMNYDDYIDLLQSVQVAIYGFKRQQGMGNIVNLIYLGKTIYLDSANPMYKFFIDNGIVIRNLDSFNDESIRLLTEEEIEHNRVKIYSLFGEERYNGLAKELFL